MCLSDKLLCPNLAPCEQQTDKAVWWLGWQSMLFMDKPCQANACLLISLSNSMLLWTQFFVQCLAFRLYKHLSSTNKYNTYEKWNQCSEYQTMQRNKPNYCSQQVCVDEYESNAAWEPIKKTIYQCLRSCHKHISLIPAFAHKLECKAEGEVVARNEIFWLQKAAVHGSLLGDVVNCPAPPTHQWYAFPEYIQNININHF